MRRIEQRFCDKIYIHGMRLEDIEKEIDQMNHHQRAQYGVDGTLFTSPYKMAKEIIRTLESRNLIIKENGKYVKPRQNLKK